MVVLPPGGRSVAPALTVRLAVVWTTTAPACATEPVLPAWSVNVMRSPYVPLATTGYRVTEVLMGTLVLPVMLPEKTVLPTSLASQRASLVVSLHTQMV